MFTFDNLSYLIKINIEHSQISISAYTKFEQIKKATFIITLQNLSIIIIINM